MTIAARKITAFTKTIAALGDSPTSSVGGSAALKAWWDSSPEELRVALGGLIDDLLATTAGASGAENIGSAPITGVAGGLPSTPYAQLVDLKAQLTGIVLGTIPDSSLTGVKLANNTVSLDNIKVGVKNMITMGAMF